MVMDVRIIIVEARDLAIKDFNGTSDPYIKVKFKVDGSTIHKEKTPVIWKDLNPIWNAKFEKSLKDKDAEHFAKSGIIRFECWDKDQFQSVNDDFMGVVSVPVEAIISLPGQDKKIDQWFCLTPRPGKNDKGIQGEIRLVIQVGFHREHVPVTRRRSGLPIAPPPLVPCPIIHVTIHSAKGLAAKDINSSDPYVLVKLNSMAKGAKITPIDGDCGFRTEIKNSTLDPVWEESFSYLLHVDEFAATNDLTLEMFDKDQVGHDDFMGEVVFTPDTIAESRDGRLRHRWFVLARGAHQQDEVHGAIHVSLSLEAETPMAALPTRPELGDPYDLALHIASRTMAHRSCTAYPDEYDFTNWQFKLTEECDIIRCSQIAGLSERPIRFSEHCAETFAACRRALGVKNSDMLESLCEGRIVGMGRSKGKSKAGFYRTHDSRFFLKTLKLHERQSLLDLLPLYVPYCQKRPRTRLPYFLGMYTVQLDDHNCTFILTKNLFATPHVIDCKFDLKGSLQGRTVGYEECSRFSVSRRSDDILKDEDWEQCLMSIELTKECRDQLITELKEDVALLQNQSLMDYSLLVGMHVPPYDLRDDGKELENASIVRSRDGTLYFCAIIDVLQRYNLSKKMEHLAKSVAYDGDLISAVNPDLYASRFLDFMSNKVFMSLDMAPSRIRRDWQLREDNRRLEAAAEHLRPRKAPHPPPPRTVSNLNNMDFGHLSVSSSSSGSFDPRRASTVSSESSISVSYSEARRASTVSAESPSMLSVGYSAARRNSVYADSPQSSGRFSSGSRRGSASLGRQVSEDEPPAGEGQSA
jgi:hypothetical protein